MTVDSGQRILIGTDSNRTLNSHTPALQISGTNFSKSTVSIINNSNDSNPAYLFFGKQRSGSAGGSTIVQDDDCVGEIRFNAADGTDVDSRVATIKAFVDGTPGSNDTPGRLVFSTTADGAQAASERLRITSQGQVKLTGTNSGNHMSTFGSNVGGLTIDDVGASHTGLEVSHGSNKVFLVASSNNSVYLSSYGTGSFVIEHTGGGGTRERLRITSGGNVNIGGNYSDTTYTMRVTGSFAATTKSFVIDHPTKENHKLQYACLEGPENSVYVRGRSSDPVIELPDYWVGLVHEDSITVNVTPIGNKNVWVESINNNSVTIGTDGSTEYFYTVFAERKDVEKLEVEVQE